jgi:hypothetical protein
LIILISRISAEHFPKHPEQEIYALQQLKEQQINQAD